MDKTKNASYWIDEFRKVENNQLYKDWKAATKEIFKLYRNKPVDGKLSKINRAKYNLLYRNVRVKMPYLIPFIPSVIVERQNKDSDPVARCSSLILERTCNKFIEQDNLKKTLDKAKLDAELAGFGQVWINYEPEFEDVTVQEESIDALGNLTLVESTQTQLKSEKIDFEYISCFDYLHNIATKEEEITWVAKRVRLSKQEFAKKFPNIDVDKVPFTSNDVDSSVWKEVGIDERDVNCDTISVWEVWDKTDKKVYVFAPVMQGEGMLEEKDYPYDIDFPCVPMGLMFDDFNDCLIPTPRHAQCLDQYKKINDLTNKIFEIVKLIRVCGAFDESLPDIEKIFDSNNDNSLISIKNATKYVEKGGLAGAITWYDPTNAIAALENLNKERDLLIKDVQAILGVYDILEGESNPQEAYGTNKLKGTFGTQRLQEDQGKIIFFAQDLLKIACSIMCQIFEPASMLTLSTIQYSTEDPALFEPAVALLQDKKLADTRLEISADEVKAYTDESYKAQILDLWKVVFDMLQTSANIIQTSPEMAGICKVAIMSTVRSHKVGRTIENALEASIDAAIAQYISNQSNKQPTPEQIIAQAESKKADAQLAKAQLDVAKVQLEAKQKQTDQDLKTASEIAKLDMQTKKMQQDMVIDAALVDIKKQAEERKQVETANEIEALWYELNHPGVSASINVGAKGE